MKNNHEKRKNQKSKTKIKSKIANLPLMPVVEEEGAMGRCPSRPN
jgi:hypothetical protein